MKVEKRSQRSNKGMTIEQEHTTRPTRRQEISHLRTQVRRREISSTIGSGSSTLLREKGNERQSRE
jgi:hypothetical protein